MSEITVEGVVEPTANSEKKKNYFMNCKSENHSSYIELKMQGWAQVASMGINEWDRLRARKNFLRLIKRYPELAESLRYKEESVPPRSQLLDRNYLAPWMAR